MKLSHYEWDPEKDLIAEGGFAEVFKAKDTNAANRWVAMKIYKEAVTRGTSGSTGQKKYSLEQEFAKIDGLSHTNIITFYGLEYIEHKDAMGRTASYPALIMEYAGEGTLKALSSRQLSDNQIEDIIISITKATGYLHSQGVIHRDLKPGNVLFSKDRNGKLVVKITDFGISKDVLGDKTIEKSFTEGVGTPHYMSPEQFFKKNFGLNGEISNRTDFWAIGVILYQLLTGKRPFGNGVKDYELIRDEITQKEVDLSGVPEKYKDFISSCLQKEAGKRAASASELLKLLEEPTFYDTIDVTLPPPTPKENAPKAPNAIDKSKDKKRTLLFAAIGVLAIGLSFGGYKFYQNSKIKSLLDLGWNNYKDGKFKEAYDSFIDASTYNSGKAYYYLGVMNEQGRGVERNYKKTLTYADKAIDLGYDMAAFYKGDLYRYGWGVPVDSIKAISYYEQCLGKAKKLAENGDIEAMHLYGLLLSDKNLKIQDSTKSFEYVKRAADKGHPIAKSNLANWYRNGFGVEKNCEEAVKLYKEGLAINFDRSIKGLGDMYYYDLECNNIEQDYKKALEYYEMAADQDNIYAQYSLGYMYQYGKGVKKDLDEALVWYTRSADGDNIDAFNNLGVVYEEKSNSKRAKEWYLKSAKKNNKYGMYNLARIYGDESNEAHFDLDSSNTWYKKASKLDHSGSQVQLGYNFLNGNGLVKNQDSAFYWYKKAALNDYRVGKYNLAVMYENGFGCTQNYAKAKEWYEKAATQNYSSAYYGLANLYFFGKGVDTNYEKAKDLYIKANNLGNKTAADMIGRVYYLGNNGISKNYTLARKWFKRGAENGVINSQYMYAYMCENKLGGSENFYEAKKWYQKAALNGKSDAMQRLGNLYFLGKGGAKSEKKSFYWFEKAAKAGDDEGQRRLGISYYYGIGTGKSKSSARLWLKKACEQNNQRACTQLKDLLN